MDGCNEGYIYLLKEEGTNNFKLGRAKQPKRRLRDLKTGNPRQIRIVVTIKCADYKKTEIGIHKKYAHYRITGTREWYVLTPLALNDLLATLNRIALSFNEEFNPDDDGLLAS